MAADEYSKGSIAYGHNDVNNKFIICHGSRMNRVTIHPTREDIKFMLPKGIKE